MGARGLPSRRAVWKRREQWIECKLTVSERMTTDESEACSHCTDKPRPQGRLKFRRLRGGAVKKLRESRLIRGPVAKAAGVGADRPFCAPAAASSRGEIEAPGDRYCKGVGAKGLVSLKKR